MIVGTTFAIETHQQMRECCTLATTISSQLALLWWLLAGGLKFFQQASS